MKVLNLTQHKATPEQIDAGVVDLHGQDLAELKMALTVKGIPTHQDIQDKCLIVAGIATRWYVKELEIWRDGCLDYPLHGVGLLNAIRGMVMLGSMPPYAQKTLTETLQKCGFECVYAVSDRVERESLNTETGVVTKVVEFAHLGFIQAF